MAEESKCLQSGSRSVFRDRHGNEHELMPDHRASVRVSSPTGYSWSGSSLTSDEAVLSYLREVGVRVNLGRHSLAMFGTEVAGKRILNVGANDGAEAVCLAGAGASEVVGTDFGSQFLTPGAKDVGTRSVDDTLAARRARVLRVFSKRRVELGYAADGAAVPVRFAEDDITASRFDSGWFDVICSWATLEHVLNPRAAFAEMARLLCPGGLAFHEYNPFFCLDGGHSLGTLDFPWGHVRLDEADYDRYLRTLRPGKRNEARDFYKLGLNRMTIDDLGRHALGAGLEVLALIPRARTEDLLMLSRAILEQARRNYAGLTVNDLICRVVRIVVRRPD